MRDHYEFVQLRGRRFESDFDFQNFFFVCRKHFFFSCRRFLISWSLNTCEALRRRCSHIFICIYIELKHVWLLSWYLIVLAWTKLTKRNFNELVKFLRFRLLMSSFKPLINLKGFIVSDYHQFSHTKLPTKRAQIIANWRVDVEVNFVLTRPHHIVRSGISFCSHWTRN